MPMVIQDFGKGESESNVLGSISQVHVFHKHEGASVVLINFSRSHLTESKFCSELASIYNFAGARAIRHELGLTGGCRND